MSNVIILNIKIDNNGRTGTKILTKINKILWWWKIKVSKCKKYQKFKIENANRKNRKQIKSIRKNIKKNYGCL